MQKAVASAQSKSGGLIDGQGPFGRNGGATTEGSQVISGVLVPTTLDALCRAFCEGKEQGA